MGVDHCHHRFLPAVFVVEIHPDFCRFSRDQRVDHGDTGRSFDNGHVRQIEVTDLIDPIRDLKQAANINQLRLTPQAGVDGIRRFIALFNKGVLLRIPDHIALFASDHLGGKRGDKASMGIGEIGIVGEGQLAEEGIIGLLSGGGGLFWRFCGKCRGASRNKNACKRKTSCYQVESHPKNLSMFIQ